MKSRSILAMLMSLVLVTALGPAAAASDHGSGTPTLRLLTQRTAAITQGGSGWVALNWTIDEEVTDFSLIVTEMSDGLSVSYPSNTGTWTGLMNGPILAPAEVDFTAINITIAADYKSSDAKMVVSASYSFGEVPHVEEFKIDVPVVKHHGEDLSQVTDTVDVAAGETAWVSLAFAGLAPRSADFTLRVGDADGLGIVYPGYGTSTSLYNDSTLEAGETDIASFMISPADPGSHRLAFEITYDAGHGTRTAKGQVLVNITP